MSTYIDAFDLLLLAAFVADDGYLNVSSSLKEWHGVGNGARGRPAPSQQTITRSSLSGALWM